MLHTILDFISDIEGLDDAMQLLDKQGRAEDRDISAEKADLVAKRNEMIRLRFSALTASDIMQIARYAKRPQTLDFIRIMCSEFTELHGDRVSADDQSIVTGLARIEHHNVVLVGHQRGRDLKSRQRHNFGHAGPAAYRKAGRLMKLAEKFGKAVVCLIDTGGAAADLPAEQGGISQAISQNLQLMPALETPIVVVIIGEGGSGGALGIGVGDRVLMLKHSIYSVIAPEGCAKILWRGDESRKEEAIEALNIRATDALRLGIIDEILPEPLGGASFDHAETGRIVSEAIIRHLGELSKLNDADLVEKRLERLRGMGLQGVSGL